MSQRKKSKKGKMPEMDGSGILIEAGQTASAADGKVSFYEFEKKKKPKIKITP